MIAFLRGIRSNRRDPELLMELRFRPLFMRVKRESPGSILACSVRASGKSAERFEITMAAASHVNFGDPATFRKGCAENRLPALGWAGCHDRLRLRSRRKWLHTGCDHDSSGRELGSCGRRMER